jgi:hypothetical protein
MSKSYYYIKDKTSGDYCSLNYDEGYPEGDVSGYYYFLEEDNKGWASEFLSYGDAVSAIEMAEVLIEDYVIVCEELNE